MTDECKVLDVQPGWLIETHRPHYYGRVRHIDRGVGRGTVRVHYHEGDGQREYACADRAIVHRRG